MTQTQEMNKSSSRHWLYGFNTVLLVLVAAVILGFAFYLTNKITKEHHLYKDVTGGGLYSLSGATTKLLADIDAKGQKYELVNLFPGDTEQGVQVADLLNEYARASRNMTTKAYALTDRDVLETAIKERYPKELKPYEETLADFEQIAAELDKFCQAEAANFAALAQRPGASNDEKEQASEYQGVFGNALPDATGKAQREIRRLTESTLPEWSKGVSILKSYLDQVVPGVDAMVDPEKTKGQLAEPLRQYLAKAKPRYDDILGKLKACQARVDKLPELKSQAVLDALGPNTILVLAPDSAKVVSQGDIYKYQSGGDESKGIPSEAFQGEQAISSALLSMVRPEKVKVVFVTSTPQNLVTGQFSAISDRLKDANFDVLEWSPPGAQPPNPNAPPPSPEPPAEGRGVVWVVLPPEQANPQMMMMGMPPPNPQPVIDAVRKHISLGGQVMILAEASSGNPMAAQSGQKFAYDELVRPFGVDVKSNYTVVKTYATPDGNVSVPQFELTRYPQTAITKPLQSLDTVFAAGRGQFGYVGAPTVVAVDDKKPADVTANVIVDSNHDADIWATPALSSDPKFDPATDMKSPVPLAVAASKTVTIDGKPLVQRMVVIGNKVFAINDVLDASRPEIRAGTLYVVPVYPGNAELFLNSVLWLAGYENMIAVSSKANVALRIEDIPPATLSGIRWGVLWAGGPLGALALGGIVLLIRRK